MLFPLRQIGSTFSSAISKTLAAQSPTSGTRRRYCVSLATKDNWWARAKLNNFFGDRGIMTNTDLLRHVGESVKSLVLGSGSLRERLAKAAPEFSVALVEPDGWPKELLHRARDINSDLTTGGTFNETIDRMTESAVRDAGERLLRLFVDVEIAIREELRKDS
jgi:hypothetical protein